MIIQRYTFCLPVKCPDAPYFPAFGKNGPAINPYLDAFYAVVQTEILATKANDPLTLNNATNTILINLNIVLYYSSLLNIHEY